MSNKITSPRRIYDILMKEQNKFLRMDTVARICLAVNNKRQPSKFYLVHYLEHLRLLEDKDVFSLVSNLRTEDKWPIDFLFGKPCAPAL